jgi:hypothetical protein
MKSQHYRWIALASIGIAHWNARTCHAYDDGDDFLRGWKNAKNDGSNKRSLDGDSIFPLYPQDENVNVTNITTTSVAAAASDVLTPSIVGGDDTLPGAFEVSFICVLPRGVVSCCCTLLPIVSHPNVLIFSMLLSAYLLLIQSSLSGWTDAVALSSRPMW